MPSLTNGAKAPRSLPRMPFAALGGGALTVAGLYLLSLHHYLVFHSIVELSTVSVALAIFLLVWNGREYIRNNYLLVVGVSYLFVGLLDMLHTLAYPGMGVLRDSGTNLATQLWIAARSLEAASLLVAFLFLDRRLDLRVLLGSYGAVTLLFLLLIFFWKLFPICFEEPSGLTPFKKWSECAISGAMLVALPLLRRHREVFDVKVRRWIAWSIALSVVSELTFTTYDYPYAFPNALGHFFKLGAFFFMYKALIETGLREPYRVLFKTLKDHERALQASRDGLAQEVEKRAARLSEMESEVIMQSVLLDAFFTHTITSLVFLSPDFTFLRVNAAYARAFGGKVSDYPGHNYFSFYPDEENQAIFERVVRTKTAHHAFARPFRFPDHPERSVMYWDWTLVPICDPDGRVSFLVFSLKDVTKRKEAEIALREKEQVLRTVISNAPVILFATDGNGVLSLSEGAALEGIGQEPGESVGTNLLEKHRDHPEIAQAIRRALSGQNVHAEFEVRGRILNTRCSPMKDATGRADGVIGVALDITEYRRTQEQLENYREQLRHADRLSTVGQLASGVAHELGTPLNVVLGRAGLIARGRFSQQEIVENAAIIREQVDRMTGLLRQLLDFARRGAPERSRVEIRRLVEETMQLLSSVGENRGVQIECTAGKTPFVIEADPGQIRQVLMNLAVNAMQAMPRGGSLKIQIRSMTGRPPGQEGEPDRRYVCIHVRDEGCGISPEHLPRIFESFFTTKAAGEGTGLGLSIALGIVQEHKGWMDVESEPGRGSCFSVYLPFPADQGFLSSERQEP